MPNYSFYRKDTGEIIDRLVTCPASLIELNTPSGCTAIDGHHDHRSKRVNISTGEVEDWQPPKPSADHEWDASTKRWQLNAVAQQRASDDRDARARISHLEAGQHRAIRESVLGVLGGAAKLQAIDDEIKSLRSKLI